MDQKLLNTIALDTLESHHNQVCSKLRGLFNHDIKKRSKDLPGAAVYHVHNTSLFECLVCLNPVFCRKNRSEQAFDEYMQFAETLKPKFMEIVEALKDFQPTGDPKDGNQSRK
jgi:hypothetical protein